MSFFALNFFIVCHKLSFSFSLSLFLSPSISLSLFLSISFCQSVSFSPSTRHFLLEFNQFMPFLTAHTISASRITITTEDLFFAFNSTVCTLFFISLSSSLSLSYHSFSFSIYLSQIICHVPYLSLSCSPSCNRPQLLQLVSVVHRRRYTNSIERNDWTLNLETRKSLLNWKLRAVADNGVSTIQLFVKRPAWIERNNAELTLLSNRIGDYWYISQGKTRIPGVNDAEEMELTDVSPIPMVYCGPRRICDYLDRFFAKWTKPCKRCCTILQRRTCCFLRKEGRETWGSEKVGPRFASPPRAPPARACCRRNRGAGDWGRSTIRLPRHGLTREQRNRTPRVPAPRSAPIHLFPFRCTSTLSRNCCRWKQQSTD